MSKHKYNGLIWDLEKKIEQKYPLCNIEWFYDIQNLSNQDGKDEKIKLKLYKIMEILCCSEKNTHIYIRIHKYKVWYIVRILIEKNVSQEFIYKMHKQMEEDMDIINEVCEKKSTLIKVIITQ